MMDLHEESSKISKITIRSSTVLKAKWFYCDYFSECPSHILNTKPNSQAESWDTEKGIFWRK